MGILGRIWVSMKSALKDQSKKKYWWNVITQIEDRNKWKTHKAFLLVCSLNAFIQWLSTQAELQKLSESSNGFGIKQDSATKNSNTDEKS